MWALKTILYFAFFFIACIASLVNPIWGVVNYLVAYQTDPTAAWWGVPLADLGIRFSLLAALCTMLGMVLSRRNLPAVPTFSWWEVGVAALFVIAAINTVAGVEYGATARHEFEKLWKVLLFTLLLGRIAASRANLKIVLWTLVAGCLYIGYDAFTAPSRAFVMGRLESIGGPDFSTTSGAAAHLSAMLPIVGAVFLIAGTWRAKLLACAAGALTVNAIIMCRTRSAFVGLLIGVLVALMAAPRVRRYRIHALLATGVVVGIGLADEHFWARMSTITDSQTLETDLATVSRKEIWLASVRIFADHPFGIGAGNFTRVIGDYDPRHNKRSTHNSLVVCFVELGVQGGFVFVCITIGSFYLLYRTMKLADFTADPLETKLIAYGLLISLSTYLVTALGTQRFYCESFWWVLALPLALHRIAAGEARRGAAVVEEDDYNPASNPSVPPYSVPYAC